MMMMHSRLFISRTATSAVHARCFASTLVLAEQLEGGKLAPATLNTYDLRSTLMFH
jgi:hypothetical protein